MDHHLLYGASINKTSLQKMEPTPTADLDRTNDKVYDCTTSVVRAVMSLSQGTSVIHICWLNYTYKRCFQLVEKKLYTDIHNTHNTIHIQ